MPLNSEQREAVRLIKEWELINTDRYKSSLRLVSECLVYISIYRTYIAISFLLLDY